MSDLDKLLINSTKAELIEELTKELGGVDKVVVILVEDKENGAYSSQVMTMGLSSTYEAYGILEVARQDLKDGDY